DDNTLAATSSPTIGYLTATSTTATSSLQKTSVSQLSIGSLSGILRAGSGFVTAGLVSLTSDISGVLGIANGGTATSTQVTNGVNYFDGTRITSGTSLVYNGTNFGIGTSTPGSILSIGTGANYLNLSSTATSTFGKGIELKTGCFSINGTCVGGGSGGGSVAGSNGQIQFNNAGAFGAASDFTWDSTYKILSVASSTNYSNLLVRYINSGPGSGVGRDFSADTYISVGYNDDTASTIGKNTYISIGGNGGSNPVGSTDGDGDVGGVVYLAGGGDGNSDSDGWGVGGAGGTINMVYGGFGSTNEPTKGADGTVNIGRTDGNKNANLYVYGTTNVMFKNTATTNGVCHSGVNLDTTSSVNTYQLVACSAAPADIAEFYPTKNDVEAGHIVTTSLDEYTYEASGSDPYTGEVLSLGNQKISILEKATSNTTILGVVSTAPFQTFGTDILKARGQNGSKPIALVGRVPLKVNGEAGDIKPGDRIALSSEAGVGKKAEDTDTTTVGIALESFRGESVDDKGKLLVFINLSQGKLSDQISNGDIDGVWILDETGNIKSLSTIDLNNQSIINIKSLESSSGKWSLDEEGKFVIKEIESDKINTNELASKKGLTTEDKLTGEFYCIYVYDGELVTESGRCEDLFLEEEELPELPDDTATTTASTTPPVDETPQGGGGGDEPNPEPEPPVEESPTEDPVVTPEPLPPTPEPEAPLEPVEEEPEPTPEPAPEEPSAPDASSEPAI
ncbi:MAG TPA: hypothetical protein VI752_01525, partial [Candidatus Paceibacterota bacterium]